MDGWRLVRLPALAALALLLTGCLKLDIDLQLRPDDAVDGGVVFAVDRDLLEMSGGSVEDITGGETPFPSDVEGVTAETYDDGKYVGQRFVFEGVSLSEFTDPTDPEGLKIERVGDTFRVSGTLDLSGPTGPTGATGFDPDALFSSAEIRIAITFPGEVISSNGRVEGNTAIWEPEFGDRLEIQATGSAVASGGGLGSALTIVLLLVGVVAVAGILALVTVSRRRPAPAVAGVEGAAEAPATEPAEAPATEPAEAPATEPAEAREGPATGLRPDEIPPPPPMP